MKHITLLVVAGLLSASVGHALTTAYSPPVGGMTITVPAGQTRSVALPLHHFVAGAGAVRGVVTGVGTNYIDVATAGWTPGAFSASANPYYLRILSGASAGRVMPVSTSANTATRLFVTNDGVDLVAGGMVVGDSYEIVLADTLSTLFGSAGIQGGADYLSADNVQVWSGSDWFVFYYNNVRNRWELRTDTDTSPTRDNYVLRADRGVMFTRRAATEFKMYVTGRVPSLAPKYFHASPGVSFLSNGLPVSITLGTLSFQTRATGWISGTLGADARSNADLVQVWSGADWLVFYHNSARNRWELYTDTETSPTRDTYPIPAGRPIMIRRLGTPANATQKLIQMPIPYTL